MRTTLLLLLAASFTLLSCRSQDLIRPGDTLEVAFEKAMNQFELGNYGDAARAFETVISIGRGTEIGQDAQFYLAETYFNDRRFLLASSEYNRYVQFHPNSPRREIVEFREAKSYYNLSPRFKLDQTYTNRAIERFRLFNSRYPNSDLREEAATLITELRDKLARRDFNAAEFYMRTRQYNSAAIYYGLVIDQFPESSWAERALLRQIEAYFLFAENSVERRQEERYEKALESYSRYLQLFPQGENRSRAEELYDRINRGLESVRNRSVAQSN
ncbi:MAG: outer membrane protein assembly factor BamD [Balneolaceae bacterium]|nr:MAG: outer membrane protein assembly factor BamD [Balneolaceae bacterium]